MRCCCLLARIRALCAIDISFRGRKPASLASRLSDVMRSVKQVSLLVMGLALLSLPLTCFGTDKVKSLKANANPAAYEPFSKLLPPESRILHAVDRLSFGGRIADVNRVQQLGLDRWIDLQLHPERLPEDPQLQRRLEPFDSLRMSIRQTYTHYPPPQMIVAVARNRAALPDDPELRAIVLRLAERYVQRKQSAADAQKAADPNDDSDLELKAKLSDIMTPEQIEILHSGKPDQKYELLASVPPEKRFDLVWALRPAQRKALFVFAPVVLRRQMMLSINPQSVVASDLAEAKLLRAIYSTRQLEELMVDFWYNHFNVFINKGADHYLVPTYERDAIRPHVFGKFYDLLLATAQSPAMLFYLDNSQSAAPGTSRPNQKKKRGLNENYGRELLELHTLGVDGGYTQKDVVEVARCFTGWTIAGPRKGGAFEYNDKIHDKGKKVVLGHTIRAGGGMNDGIEVLKILAHHPSTARFICLQLAKKFVADDPPPSLVNRMAKTFSKKDGDIREVMHTMLTSPEFWSEGAYRAKVKTPLESVASAIRATDADVESALALVNEVQKLGEPLYRKIEPTGYSSSNVEWVSSAGLLERMNFGLALAHNRVAGVKVDTAKWQSPAQSDPLALAGLILARAPSEATREAIEKALDNPDLQKQLTANAKAGPPQLPSLIAGLTLGSPDFQRR